MFRPYVWAIIRLRFSLQGVAIQAAWGVFESVGGWWGWWERDLVVSIVDIMIWGYYKWIIIIMCTQKTNDNPLIITPGHDTHYWNNEISFPSTPQPPTLPKTPHIACIATPCELKRNLMMAHI